MGGIVWVYNNTLARRSADGPADLYRPNYWGFGNHIDEPGVHNWGLPQKLDSESPPPELQAVAALQESVRKAVAERGQAGIARQVGWGVAFYHPNEVKLKSATIPLLYSMGASYFWAWSGWVGITDNSGLPHPYQRYYNSGGHLRRLGVPVHSTLSPGRVAYAGRSVRPVGNRPVQSGFGGASPSRGAKRRMAADRGWFLVLDSGLT